MKILIAGAGGAPSEGVIRSLLHANSGDTIIGMGSDPSDLILSAAHKKYWVPYANDESYSEALSKILAKEKPDLIHFQNDLEVFEASKIRSLIHSFGTKTYLPRHEVIDTCVDKYKSYQKFLAAGIQVPQNLKIHNEGDLKKAFQELGDPNGSIWLRASSIGGGGKGAVPTNDFEFAKKWIERYKGWGDFIAAEMLSPETVTWLSIWHEGKLIVAQTRKRKGWVHGNRTLSGVTGVTKTGMTFADPTVDEIAQKAVFAVDDCPHGIYGVDMTYDKNQIPNPTEINIARFFTTILFFTEAGLNLPEIYKNIALHGIFPQLDTFINPLPQGLYWMRGMDTSPRLVTDQIMEEEIVVL